LAGRQVEGPRRPTGKEIGECSRPASTRAASHRAIREDGWRNRSASSTIAGGSPAILDFDGRESSRNSRAGRHRRPRSSKMASLAATKRLAAEPYWVNSMAATPRSSCTTGKWKRLLHGKRARPKGLAAAAAWAQDAKFCRFSCVRREAPDDGPITLLPL